VTALRDAYELALRGDGAGAAARLELDGWQVAVATGAHGVAVTLTPPGVLGVMAQRRGAGAARRA